MTRTGLRGPSSHGATSIPTKCGRRKPRKPATPIPNLPHVGGRYAKLGDHIEDFIAGFEDYAKFLLRRARDADQGGLFDGFAGLAGPQGRSPDPVLLHAAAAAQKPSEHGRRRHVVGASRLPRAAGGLGEELRSDWPLQRAERTALVALNVPHFVSPSDAGEISDATGISVRTEATPGLERARARAAQLRRAGNRVADRGDPAEYGRGFTLLRLGPAVREASRSCAADRRRAGKEIFVAEADRIADELARLAIRRGSERRLDRSRLAGRFRGLLNSCL